MGFGAGLAGPPDPEGDPTEDATDGDEAAGEGPAPVEVQPVRATSIATPSRRAFRRRGTMLGT
jgi:hypothetical protein